MQVASILSDLTSLRVCDHSAAIALVSANKFNTLSMGDLGTKSAAESMEEDDEDIKRVNDLMDLHHNVKISHMHGEDNGLKQARTDVDRVLRQLDGKKSEHGVGGL